MLNWEDESIPDWVPEVMGFAEEVKSPVKPRQSAIEIDAIWSKSVKVASPVEEFNWDMNVNTERVVSSEIKPENDFDFNFETEKPKPVSLFDDLLGFDEKP